MEVDIGYMSSAVEKPNITQVLGPTLDVLIQLDIHRFNMRLELLRPSQVLGHSCRCHRKEHLAG